MPEIEPKELLNKREVVEEIHRHLWIESEKAGQNIGFENASEDWLKRFAGAWLQYHMPNHKLKALTTQVVSPANKSNSKKRQAKSYLK